MQPVKLALYFGNRGFFPETLVAAARQEVPARLEQLGYGALLMPAGATRYGAVESAEEGRQYAAWLEAHRGQFAGVLLCLPNFGDETGAVAALQDARVPILLHAYPDELGKMGFESRRDAFCGKLSIMDVFGQYGIPFTAPTPHTVHPASDAFASQVHDFFRVCCVVNGMRRLTVGAIGARTTAFKTVRFDELALQRHGITTETVDLTQVFQRVRLLADSDARCRQAAERLRAATDCSAVPAASLKTLARLSVVLDEFIAELRLDALAIRCWLEIEQELKVAPCVLAGDLNQRGIPCACEVDVCNAVAMLALQLASGRPAACLDWNNNYGDDPDKCILFHCGPVPPAMMAGPGKVIDHPMFAKALGAGCGWGPNTGRIAAGAMSYAAAKTDNGRLSLYVGEGEMTADPIAPEFFGCAGVARIAGLQRKLQSLGYAGYRHHVTVTFGCVEAALREAFQRHLGYEVTEL